jgi:Bacterial antitoxin of type II TA system, VapB
MVIGAHTVVRRVLSSSQRNLDLQLGSTLPLCVDPHTPPDQTHPLVEADQPQTPSALRLGEIEALPVVGDGHMKITIQIPDSLFEEARQLAHRERTTLKALVEEGLRRIISERKRRGGFHLRRATFRGDGLQPHLAGASWDQIRDLGYEGRGG